MIYGRDASDVIDHFAALVLGHIDQEYPNKLDHVMNSPDEVKSPRALHPIFCGSYDWHSSVHGHWLLIRALRLYPNLGQRADIVKLLTGRFTPEKVKVEVDYLGQKSRGTFERTYGWAWLLKLAAELELPLTDAPDAPAVRDAFAAWRTTLAPLTEAFVARFLKYLPKATYPIRVGTHNNSAFGLALALDYARTAKRADLADLITAKARDWYKKDRNYPAWEPDGTDFLSPGLMEAELMRRTLTPAEFAPWLDAFFPALAQREPATLFTPAIVSDRADAQITHLDGLNFARSWCWRAIASTLAATDPRKPILEASAKEHLEAALPHVSGDYVGEHWLATFAMLAMTE